MTRGKTGGKTDGLSSVRRADDGSRGRLSVAAAALLPAVLLSVAVLWRWHGTLSGYWRWDDTALLNHLLKYPCWWNFWVPEVYRELSCANLTPWVFLSFRVDQGLFGLDPAGFYTHHLVSLGLAAAACQAVLSLWLPRRAALCGALLFLAGAPVATVAQRLMTRHYIEGMIFALAAVYGYVRFVRGGSRVWLGAAMGACLLAVTAKEIYVPLIFLPLCVAEGDIRRRLGGLAALGLVAAVYVPWRVRMLGVLLGGYGGGEGGDMMALLPVVGRGLARLPVLAGGPAWMLSLGIWLVLVGIWVGRRPARALRAVLLPALVLLPLVPLTVSPGIANPDRYLLLPWLVLVMTGFLAGGVLVRETAHGRNETVVKAAVLLLAAAAVVPIAAHGCETGRDVGRVAAEFDIQGRFAWRHNDPTIGFMPTESLAGSYWYINFLGRIKERTGHGRGMPQGILDDWLLDDSIGKLYAYDPDAVRMRDISADIAARRATAGAGVRPAAPLEVVFSYRPGLVTWRFGPQGDGWYHLLAAALGVRTMPPAGGIRAVLPDRFTFRVRYTSPEGWRTFSPPFIFAPGGTDIRWSREPQS
ncbi:MAG: hypothetical protein JW781_06395 [Deltaproteobacteria bacterium]|nr:hypothetical protein [Candidatus Anaeroferrophillacea bacterium]